MSSACLEQTIKAAKLDIFYGKLGTMTKNQAYCKMGDNEVLLTIS